MAAISNSLKSNLLSNIVFLDILLYHNRLKQSSLFSSLNGAIPGTMPVHRIEKSAVEIIIIKELQPATQNLISFLFLAMMYVLNLLEKFHIIRSLFGILYFSAFLQEFISRRKPGIRKTWGHAEIAHRCSSLKCNSFTNSGKPAAILFLLMQLKVVDLIQEGSAAAGLLGGLVREAGWNDDESIHDSLDEWGNGGMGEWMNKCMVAWLLGNFLIVNCQLSMVKRKKA